MDTKRIMTLDGTMLRTFNLVLMVELVLTSSAGASSDLKLVEIIIANGDSSQASTFPRDIHPPSDWPQGYDQLTKSGMRQQYHLGQFIREKYRDFLGHNFKNAEIFVQSSDFDKTLMSAEANLAGLFPPTGDQIWNEELPWQPVPVHAKPSAEDYKLNMNHSCDRYDQLLEQTFHSGNAAENLSIWKDFINKHYALAGWNENDTQLTKLKRLGDLYQILHSQFIHGMTLPSWITEHEIHRLGLLTNELFNIVYSNNDLKSIRAGPLLADVINKMQDKLGNNTSRKMFMYFSDIPTIAAILHGLNLWTYQTPPYASAIFVELHAPILNEPHIRIYYKNDSNLIADESNPDLTIPLTIPDCGSKCSLKNFQKLIKPSLFSGTYEEWMDMCQVEKEESLTTVAIVLIAVILIVVMCFGTFIIIIFKRDWLCKSTL